MRTSIDLSDELFRRAKAAAALRGCKFKELVEDGLLRVLEFPAAVSRRPKRKPTLSELMRSVRGVAGSGVKDLAGNPKHMKNYGRD